MNFVPSSGIFRHSDQAALEAIAARTGMGLLPEEMVTAVREAFIASQQQHGGGAVEGDRPACPSSDIFRSGLARSRQLAPVQPSILVLGAGKGIPGRDSAYAAGVVDEVFEGQCRITRLEWTEPHAAAPAREYDLVVSHSLAHFLFGVDAFLRFAAAKVRRTGGGYVMASEPNRRFWANAEIASRMVEKREAKRLLDRIRPFLRPAKLLVTGSHSRSSETQAFDSRVNAYLRERHGLRKDLTFKEINRIADPYFPDELLGQYPPLGANGFDWENELPGMLAGFRREWIATARFLGKRNPRMLDAQWTEIHDELERRYPLDGNVFTALWWRDAA